MSLNTHCRAHTGRIEYRHNVWQKGWTKACRHPQKAEHQRPFSDGSEKHSILPITRTRSNSLLLFERLDGSDGIAYPSVRGEGDCVGLFYPDLVHNPTQDRHLAYHWDGTRVDIIREATTGDVFRIVD